MNSLVFVVLMFTALNIEAYYKCVDNWHTTYVQSRTCPQGVIEDHEVKKPSKAISNLSSDEIKTKQDFDELKKIALEIPQWNYDNHRIPWSSRES